MAWSPNTKQPTDQRVNSKNEHDFILIQDGLWNLDQDGKRNRPQQEQSHFHQEQPAALWWDSCRHEDQSQRQPKPSQILIGGNELAFSVE
jgi:hypothetical protein